MKITTIIIRTLVGLLLLFASLSYFFKLMPEPELAGNMKTFNEGIVASTYLMPLAKVLELICGLAFVSGRFVALANIVILPITLNILLINYYMAPEGIAIAGFLFLANIFLIHRYWNNYQSLFLVR